MSAHVAPHRWADAFAGKLGEREVATMELHAESCTTCARTRDRVHRASQSFPALRAQTSPELGWDSVRARVRWAVSSEQRAKQRASRVRLVPVLAVGALATGAAVLALSTDFATPSPTPRPQPVAVPEPARPAPTPLGALVVRELGDQVMVSGLVRRRVFDEVLGQGATVATGHGSVDVQFDTDSALALGPQSMLAFKRFDSERIELALDEGTVDIVVAKRGPDQRFIVTIGDGARAVEVRGTRFRVSLDEHGTARVACSRGKVVVRDGAGEVEVAAGRELELAANADVAGVQPGEISPEVRELLAHATPMTLPIWTAPDQLVKTSAPLEVATAGKRDVRVDGVEVGQGPLRMRVMPGRHTIEAVDSAGRFRRAGWIDAAVGKPARLEVHVDATPTTGNVAARRKQLHAGIDRARLSQCTRAIAKAGVTDTYVRIEIAIDETGAVQFLNVIDTDLPSTTASCVREVLADVRFKPGAAATFRDKLDL